MKKNMIKLGAVVLVVAIAGVCAVFFTRGDKQKEALASEIEYNFARMSELDTNTLLSSNPYDYIDNEFYENIVELGIPAIEILEEKYKDGELTGLDAYIAGIAIQEISGLDLYEATGKSWENADQFFAQWENTIQALPDTFEEIAASEDPVSGKIETIKSYGVFGEAFLQTVSENSDEKGLENLNYCGKKISAEAFADDENKKELEDSINITEDTLQEANAYLESCFE